jgi:N-carbamoylputrescine amidase
MTMVVKVAVAQFSGNVDRQANVDKAEALARRAAGEGARVVCFPELASSIYFCYERNPAFFGLAEPVDGPSVTQMRRVARQTGTVIVYPFYELDAGRRFNTAAVIGPDGELIGQYRKNSIPAILRTRTAGETPGDEKFFFEPGDLGFPVFETPFGLRLGILICYDRHFPEAARVLGLRGADIVFVPTATYRPWIREVWEVELRGHAIANTYYVGGVNKVGPDAGGAPNRHYFGSSLFIDPRGQVLARASDQGDEVIYADVDRALIEDTRDLWGFFRDRRPELYGSITEPVAAGRDLAGSGARA